MQVALSCGSFRGPKAKIGDDDNEEEEIDFGIRILGARRDDVGGLEAWRKEEK